MISTYFFIMASARVPVLLILFIYFQGSHQQQCSLVNNLNLQQALQAQQELQKNAATILISKNINQIPNVQNQFCECLNQNSQQQLNLQQQNPSLNNLQFIRQQNNQNPSLTVSNGKLSFISSQIAPASGTSIISNFPSAALSNSCGCNSAVGQTQTFTQNNLGTTSNIPVIQTSNSLPVPENSPSIVLDLSALKNQYTSTSQQGTPNVLSLQNGYSTLANQQNQVLSQSSPCSLQNQVVLRSPQTSVITINSQQALPPVQTSLSSPQIYSQTTSQSSGVPTKYSVQAPHQSTGLPLQYTVSTSPQYSTSQKQYPKVLYNYLPNSNTNLPKTKPKPKSSSLKMLLPLLYNLLKEKSNDCDSNCNCGCKNYNNCHQNPQIQSGYSNQMNYGQYYPSNPPVTTACAGRIGASNGGVVASTVSEGMVASNVPIGMVTSSVPTNENSSGPKPSNVKANVTEDDESEEEESGEDET